MTRLQGLDSVAIRDLVASLTLALVVRLLVALATMVGWAFILNHSTAIDEGKPTALYRQLVRRIERGWELKYLLRAHDS